MSQLYNLVFKSLTGTQPPVYVTGQADCPISFNKRDGKVFTERCANNKLKKLIVDMMPGVELVLEKI